MDNSIKDEAQREHYHDLLDSCMDKTGSWINPKWEPYEKCAEEDRKEFVLMLHLIGRLYPKSLGAMDVRFEKCSPYRSFGKYDPNLGHNDQFMDDIVTMALGPEPLEPSQ